MKARLLILSLALVTLISMLSFEIVLGESKTIDLNDGNYRYENDFSGDKESITKDPMLGFLKPDEFTYKEGKLSIEGSTWALFSSTVALGEKPYTVTLDLSAKEVNKGNTAGAALNVRGKKTSTFMGQGITFIVKNNRLGVLKRGNEIASITLPFSFETTIRKVYIEDNLTEIKFSANDDKQVKTLLATLEFTDNKLVVKDSSGTEKGSKKDPGVLSTGYFTFMSHFALSTVDNITYEYYKEPYYPVDMTDFRDTFYDTWVVTDALGRVAPISYKDSQKEDKKVGLFYFIWHEMTGPLFDHNSAYNEGGLDAVWDMMRKGDVGYGHYWAEPYFGYYRSDDEWILRKHSTMLVNAGVDFIYFDMSNGKMRPHIYLKLLEVWRKMREEGAMTPQFICFLGDRTDLGYNTAMEAWNTLYKDGTYKDFWFMWEGKPLVLGNFENVPKEIQEHLTIRRSWAFTDKQWYTESKGNGKWPWIALYPQGPGKNFKGVIEQVVVSCGFHSNSSLGRSYHNGEQPTDGKNGFEFELKDTPYGLAFKEQWEQALKIDPPIVMITGWNEWWAGRWPDAGPGQKIANTFKIKPGDPKYQNNYVDCFNPEFSRDVEPMKGGFGDNYYYQMVSYIRQFKGTRAVPVATGTRTVSVNSDFTQWDNVGPEFRDTIYDVEHRDHAGNAAKLHYINDTGRNDIDYAKVTHDDVNIYLNPYLHSGVNSYCFTP